MTQRESWREGRSEGEGEPQTGEELLARITTIFDEQDVILASLGEAEENERVARQGLIAKVGEVASAYPHFVKRGVLAMDDATAKEGLVFGRAARKRLVNETMSDIFYERAREEMSRLFKGRQMRVASLTQSGIQYFTGYSTRTSEATVVEGVGTGAIERSLDSFILRASSANGEQAVGSVDEYAIHLFRLQRDEQGRRVPAVDIEFL